MEITVGSPVWMYYNGRKYKATVEAINSDGTYGLRMIPSNRWTGGVSPMWVKPRVDKTHPSR